MKKLNRELGKRGEEIAAKYLQGKGFQVLEQNFSTKFGEIDLVAEKAGILHFVEVKLKQGEDFGTPEEMINPEKLTRVQNMADYYLMAKTDMEEKYQQRQIDAVCIVLGLGGEVVRINLYENLGF